MAQVSFFHSLRRTKLTRKLNGPTRGTGPYASGTILNGIIAQERSRNIVGSGRTATNRAHQLDQSYR